MPTVQMMVRVRAAVISILAYITIFAGFIRLLLSLLPQKHVVGAPRQCTEKPVPLLSNGLLSVFSPSKSVRRAQERKTRNRAPPPQSSSLNVI